MGKLLTLTLLFTLLACQTESQPMKDHGSLPQEVELVTPSNEIIETRLAITMAEQEQGLSGVKPEDFEENEGLLFIYLEEGDKYFWMPDTYFNLDIFYLDSNLKILDIIRKLPFYIGRSNPNLIPKARVVWSKHVLEMKASSKIAEKLKVGDVLKWKAKMSLPELEAKLKSNLKK